MPGKLYLVGAGPGDPSLLTLKGRRCLELADVVVYDYLANSRLLEFTPPGCERLLVGKHGGGARVDQEHINRLLVGRALQGKVVVRLKGGDPFIFGRGAEEALAARQAGIDYEVVPGVTSAIAVPAYAGIPLTHRDLASGVSFVAGYEYPGKHESAVRWGPLAATGTTLVILMTQRQLAGNMERLVAGGLDPDTPAAVVTWGTRAAQRTVIGTAATIADEAARAHIDPPAIAIVGDVVRLRQQLEWFERRPLFGTRIVITRPRQQAADFADQLEALGAEIIPFPTIETVAVPASDALDGAIRRAADFDWVVFTSANGVRVFFDRLRQLGADIRAWHRARFAAIGPQTARALEACCVCVDAVPDEFRAEGVIEVLGRHDLAGRRVLLPRAAGARQILPEKLRALGATVEEVITYAAVRPNADTSELRTLLTQGQIDLLTFTSSSTVDHFVALMGDDVRLLVGRTTIGCIGPITAETVRRYGWEAQIQPAAYTIPAFVEAIIQHFTAARARRP
jgi:uroporphyrinogen III methyltransferase/synthase